MFSSKFEVLNHFSCYNGHFFDAKRPSFSSIQEGKMANTSEFFSLFLPHHYLNLHSCHRRNSFIFCWFHQNHPTESAKNTTISRRMMIFLLALVKSSVHTSSWPGAWHRLPFLSGGNAGSHGIVIHWPSFCFCHGNIWTAARRGPKHVDFVVWG